MAAAAAPPVATVHQEQLPWPQLELASVRTAHMSPSLLERAARSAVGLRRRGNGRVTPRASHSGAKQAAFTGARIAGMMSAAYFVGRKQILEWANASFDMSLTKIEEFANGAVALQMMDALFPGSVPMSKVRWDARTAPEMTTNYKLLQQAFE
jgi:hypothetical protein